MADTEPIESTPVEDVQMGGAGDEQGLTELEPEAPKLVLFADLA